MKKALLASVLTFCMIGTYAQLTSCTQTLRLARSTYEQGRLHEIEGLFSRCLENGFTQQEKVEAYKLLCLSYIYLEEPQKADGAMLNLLRTDHYFQINESTDPAEFIALYRTFRTKPIYRIGAKFGANASQPHVISYVPANDGTSEYHYGIGFKSGLEAEIPLKKKFTLNPGIVFSLKNFSYKNTATYTESATGEPRTFNTKATESQAWLSVPVVVQYEVVKSKFNPYISLGLSADYLISARNKYSRSKEQATSLEEQSVTVTGERKSFQLSALASAGGKMKVTGGFALLEVRYSHGLTKVNDKQNIYSLFDRTFPTGGYVDGIFKLNSISITVGYVYNIFNPKKLNK